MPNTTPPATLEQSVLHKIAAELVALKLLHPSQATDLTSGKPLTAEDWRLLAEKALMLQEREAHA